MTTELSRSSDNKGAARLAEALEDVDRMAGRHGLRAKTCADLRHGALASCEVGGHSDV